MIKMAAIQFINLLYYIYIYNIYNKYFILQLTKIKTRSILNVTITKKMLKLHKTKIVYIYIYNIIFQIYYDACNRFTKRRMLKLHRDNVAR